MFLPLLVSVAHAAIFQEKTGDGDWFEAPIERGLTLPRGWMSVELRLDSKRSTAFRRGGGAVVPYTDGTVFTTSTAWLDISQGFSDRTTFYLQIPWVSSHLRNDLGADIRTTALGDAHAGLIYGLPKGLALQVDLKTPSGVEWPHDYTNGTTGFLTGTGTTHLGLRVHERYALDRVAAHAWAEGVWRIPGIVGYVVEKEGFGNGWMDPGDSLGAGLSGSLALGERALLTLGGEGHAFQMWQMGTSGASVWTINKEPVPHTGGLWAFATGGLSVSLNEHWGASYEARWQALGTDSRVFGGLGLEAFSPQPGVTHALALEGRF